jgi:ring-1,2-phenylacetyl-CoA epoxidase subunit PaaD
MLHKLLFQQMQGYFVVPLNLIFTNNFMLKKQHIYTILNEVADPEIPVLTIQDLGIIRDVNIYNNNHVEVIITPTYNGCPAMDMIATNIKLALAENGIVQTTITTVLSPAWTTDWMTEDGKQKLKQYGIAAPNKKFEIPEDGVECPQCNSNNTKLISHFGSTACKALYQCINCKEPFDYFKCH